MTDLAAIWQSRHRGRLHDISSWNTDQLDETDETISLTYAPTGAGATGPSQMQRFFALFPPSSHPLDAANLNRFNNQYKVLSCIADGDRRMVMEEIAISCLHNERLDYLMPGLPASNLTYSLNLVIVAQYSTNCLLQQVRIYWDQATLLKQLNTFPIAFHNLIHAAGKAVSFENELDRLPITDGIRIAKRLFNPTPQNCNPMISLEALESFKSELTPKPTKLSPIGGLDNISEMAYQLPNVSSKVTQPVRTTPALQSSVFNSSRDTIPVTINNSIKSTPALVSTLALGDGSSDPVKPIQQTQPKPSIFSDENENIPYHPSVTIDPSRYVSRVFKEPDSPFQPNVPLTDHSRFDSKIFSSNDTGQDTTNCGSVPRQAINPQLQSHIFDEQTISPTIPVKAPNVARSSKPFGTDDEKVQAINPIKTNVRMNEGHFHGSGFAFSGQDNDAPSFSRRPADYSSNRLTLSFTSDFNDEAPRSVVNPRAASHNVSQIQFGDNGSVEAPKISTRVLQPPGGRSSIFLD